MKKLIAAVAALAMASAPCACADPWEGHENYDEENAALTEAPKAVFMGNSITEIWPSKSKNFWKQHPEFAGRGISGQTSSQILRRFQKDVIDLGPEVVVLLAGTNDVAQNPGYVSKPEVVENIGTMVETALAHGMKVAVCSLPPCDKFSWKPELEPAGEIVELNGMIEEYVESLGREDVRYVDYHTAMADEKGAMKPGLSYDRCHPTSAGFRVMEGVLAERLGDWLGIAP